MCSSSTGALEGHSTHLLAGRSDLHLPLDPPAGGLQMAHSFEHIPVLGDEVVSLFASVPPGVVVDATVGGGGHAAALLEAYPALRVVGLDRDPAALDAARPRLSAFGDRVTLVRAPLLVAGRACLGPRARAALGRPLRPRRQLTPARPGRAGLLLSRRRPARHADGPVHRRDGRRPGERASRGVSGRAVPRERRGPPVGADRPGRRQCPATHLDEAAGRSRVGGGARGGPPQGPPGQSGLPGPADRGQRRVGSARARRRPLALSHLPSGACAGDQLPLRRGPVDQADLRRGRHGWLRLPPGPALRLRRRGAPPSGLSGCPPASARGDRRQPSRRKRPAAGHRADRARSPSPQDGAP